MGSLVKFNLPVPVLPDFIFNEIMLMIGLESLESLHRCRQVCKTWNEKIMRNIWKNPSKVKMIQTATEESWSFEKFPTDEEISHVKWLGI